MKCPLCNHIISHFWFTSLITSSCCSSDDTATDAIQKVWEEIAEYNKAGLVTIPAVGGSSGSAVLNADMQIVGLIYVAAQGFENASIMVNLNEIIVKNNNSGKPYFNFEGNTKKLLKKKFKNKEIKTSLSLSDENKYAVAFVTISLWKKIKFF